MEALVALSFACNVLQLAETGYNVATIFRQAYKEGTTKHNSSLEFASQRLSLCLQEFYQAPSCQLQGAEKALYEMGSKIASDAQSLYKLVEPATADGSTSTRKKLKSGWTAFRYAGKIEDYEAKLRAQQETLNTMILVDLRKRLVLTDAQNDRHFSQLSIDVQDFINEQARLQLEALGKTRALVRHEGALTRADIDAKLNALTLENRKAAVRERFLNSLRFPDMNRRKTDITQSHAGTLEWILEDGNHGADYVSHEADAFVRDRRTVVISENSAYDNNRWEYPNDRSDDNENFWNSMTYRHNDRVAKDAGFVKWLSGSEANYWICGSAGSGKSTLMQFLSEHKSTRSYLKQWAEAKELVVTETYIWNAGTEFQRTYKGVLATMLFQLIEQSDTEKIDSLIHNKKYEIKRTIVDWTVAEIEEQILSLIQDPVRCFCLFIDGLDELEPRRRSEDDEILLRYIGRISAFSNVKCCLSSRPEQLFEVFFRDTDKLRLEQLNANDIRLLCVESLKQTFQGIQKVLNETERRDLESLIHSLVYRANGAFLWAHLVLGQMRQGIRVYDEITELYQYLESLPSEISKLYEHMWAKNNNDLSQHREEAADYIKLVLLYEANIEPIVIDMDARMISPVQLAFMFDQKFQNIDAARISSDEIIKACERVRERVRMRSAGLLHIAGDEFFWKSSQNYKTPGFGINASMENLRVARVEFIHRTAKDFLLTEPIGHKIRSGSLTSAGDLIGRFLYALLLERSLLSRIPYTLWLDKFCSLFRLHCDLFQPLQNAKILEKLESTCLSTFERVICKYPGVTFQQYAMHSLSGQYIGSRTLLPLDFNAWAFRRGISSGISSTIESHLNRLNPEYCKYLLCILDLDEEVEVDHKLYETTSILLEQIRSASDSVTYIQCTIPYSPIRPLPSNNGSVTNNIRGDDSFCYEGSGSISGVRRSVCRGLIELMIGNRNLLRSREHFYQMVPLVNSFLEVYRTPIMDQLVIETGWQSASAYWPGYYDAGYRFGILVDYDLRELLRWYQKEGQVLSSVYADDYYARLPISAGLSQRFTVRAITSKPNESVVPEWRRPSAVDCGLIADLLSKLPFLPAPMDAQQEIDLQSRGWRTLVEQVNEVWGRSSSQGWLDILKECEYIIPCDDARVMKRAPPMFLDAREGEGEHGQDDDEDDEFFESAE